jgi:hypothetical protein
MTSSNNDLRNLVQRLERIERQNRRLKSAGALILALGGAALLMGQTKEGQPQPPAAQPAQRRVGEFDILETRRFIVKDSNGMVRFFMTTMPDGSPSLELRTADGKPRVALTCTDGGFASVLLHDNNGLSHASITVAADGAPLVELRDKDQKVVFKAPEKAVETPAGK